MVKSISLFAPAYNEEENIEEFVRKADKFLNTEFDNFEIIIINDGSTDKTAEILAKIKKDFRRLKIITHDSNKGYGAALRSGFDASTKDLIFFTDSDMQFDLEEIKTLVKETKNSPVVIGYRRNRGDSLIRIINAKIWAFIVSATLSVKAKDIDCAFKVFERKVIKGLRLKSSGAVISAELLAKIKDKGYRIKEIPVSHFPRTKGKQTGASIKVIFHAALELIKLKKSIKEKV